MTTEEDSLWQTASECFDGHPLEMVAMVALGCFLSACQAMCISKESVVQIVKEAMGKGSPYKVRTN